MRSLVKLLAGVCVCKVPDAQAVGGVELSHEELAARLPHRAQLQDGGGRQQNLGQGFLYISALSTHKGYSRQTVVIYENMIMKKQ